MGVLWHVYDLYKRDPISNELVERRASFDLHDAPAPSNNDE